MRADDGLPWAAQKRVAQALQAAPGDVVAVPCWHAHAVEAPQDTTILRVSDEPLLAKLGLARTAAH